MSTHRRRTGPPDPAVEELAARLPALTIRDERRIARRLDGLRRQPAGERRDAALAAVSAEVAAAEERLARRAAAVPAVSYPEELPVSARRDDLVAALREHQVVVVAGETGSGKTTQLPKMLLEVGCGVRGRIGHTQPRRIAARAVADRLAEELHVPLGDAVGYQVRFTDRVSDRTLVKVMTDGILLAEIQRDRTLSAYDAIIVDEAHERSLNIDFLLGYLTRLLPRRPDLRLVITSATIDPERFARHFGGAPVVEVSGRTYPVEVRYRPMPVEDRDQVQAVVDAVQELSGEGPGDVLVFLSGEREIRDTADALAKAELRHTEILPLYARLSAAEQHRVFSPHPGRRVVLATNVAETSLTVPGIRYVVDAGTARISRYSHRLHVQRLPIEPVSQASANQRAGRCGRVEAGIAVRLYDEEDYLARPEFTDPEIQRTNLASVILQMAALGLGDIASFPFVDPPDRRSVKDGVALLEELGALEPHASEPDGTPRLTELGRRLARLPLDPRLGRMVLAAEEAGCLHEVLVVTAALSIQDPRERPTDKEAAADAMHRRFVEPESDFLTLLNLWNHLRAQQKALSGNAFRRMCRDEYLHYLRVREWQELVAQLREVVVELGMKPNRTSAPPDQVHKALLAGLLSHLGQRDPERRDYLGARGGRFTLWPGSALARKQPDWVMAAELVETSRLFGRMNARIDPAWVEPIAGHLLRRTYSEPRWSRRRGAVVAQERVTLYGLPIVVDRTVPYHRVDPSVSRELFLRHALVEGDWNTQHRFFHANRELVADVEELESRARRRDILVSDEDLFAFYDARIPSDVVSARHFDSWWKKERRRTPDLLDFTADDVVNAAAARVADGDYPPTWDGEGLSLPLSYRFEPGAEDDGVTVEVPLEVLHQLDPDAFSWQVPGLREELVVALLRTLPKQQRRALVPVPDTVAALMPALSGPPGGGSLTHAVARALRDRVGLDVPVGDFRPDDVPAHLRPLFRVAASGGTVASSRDLPALQRELAPRGRAQLADVTAQHEEAGLRDFPGVPLADVVERAVGGQVVRGYPALVDEGEAVALRVLPSPRERDDAHLWGVVRLVRLAVPSPLGVVQRGLTQRQKLALAHNPYPSVVAMLEDCADAAAATLVESAGGPPRDAAGFARVVESVRPELAERTLHLVRVVADVLADAAEVAIRSDELTTASLRPALADIRQQVAALVFPRFVSTIGEARVSDVRRYLRAVLRRLDALPADPPRDLIRMEQVERVQAAYASAVASLPDDRRHDADVRDARWLVEELRVSLFAQQLGTPFPVSEKRIAKVLDTLAAG